MCGGMGLGRARCGVRCRLLVMLSVCEGWHMYVCVHDEMLQGAAREALLSN